MLIARQALGWYTKDNDHTAWGWEVTRLLAQSPGTVYQPLCKPQLSPPDVRSTSEDPPVWLIGSASEDYLWRALQIHSSPSSSSSSLVQFVCLLKYFRLVKRHSRWKLSEELNVKTRWLYCVECPQYSTRWRSASNIHRSSMLRKNR